MGFAREVLLRHPNPAAAFAAMGWVYNFSESAANGTVTGQTSFAATTPTFTIAAPVASSTQTAYCIVPLYASLGQAGTVAGGAISVYMEVDNAYRYASGGSDMTVQNARMDGTHTLPSGVIAKTGVTATSAAGVRVWGVLVGQDVSPAEGVSNELVWTPPAGPELVAATTSVGATWNIFTWAGTTGPTWLYSLKAAIFPASEL